MQPPTIARLFSALPGATIAATVSAQAAPEATLGRLDCGTSAPPADVGEDQVQPIVLGRGAFVVALLLASRAGLSGSS